MSGRVTLATVATSAGVSVATVSKVLNGRSDVSESTRARVQEVLKEHDYIGLRPEQVERTTVELFFQGVVNSYSIEVIQGVLEVGAAADVDVVLSSRPPRSQARTAGRAAGWIREIIANGRRAAIGITSELTEADLAALSRARLPLVVVDPINIAQPEVTSVGSTNFAGGMTATQHLLSLGHRKIAYLGGPPTSGCNQARMNGYRGAMEAAGLVVCKDYVWMREFLYDDGLAERRCASRPARTTHRDLRRAATRSPSA